MCGLKTDSFFCKLRKVMESPNPAKASSAMTLMLFDLRSKWRNLCNLLNASVGIVWMLLSPRRRYCRFSIKEKNWKSDFKSNINLPSNPANASGSILSILFPSNSKELSKVRWENTLEGTWRNLLWANPNESKFLKPEISKNEQKTD